MVSDEILSREASLIYQNTFGFEPVEGDLNNWHGLINDKLGNTIGVTIVLSNNFPNDPPNVYLREGLIHPNITNGKFLTRSLARWKSNYHVHQIIREVRQVISSSIVQSGTSAPLQARQKAVDSTLNNQLGMLKQQLEMKKQDYHSLDAKGVGSNQVNNTLSELTEDTLVDLQNEIFALEDSYDRAEVNGLEFSKRFLALQKRYYMIEKTK